LSLNRNCSRLIKLLKLLEFEFDVIILSEIWTCNIDSYCNILARYDFYYDLPVHTNVGNVGIFVRSEFNICVLPQYKLKSNDINKIENIWLEITTDNKNKYLLGAMYRHPNQNISDFTKLLDNTLASLSNQKLLCII